jgi:toxin YoeB
MDVIFASEAWKDYHYWQQTDKKTLKKINTLVQAICREPFEGIGNSEPLKHNLSGYWSRRISLEHRLVYRITDKQVRIIQCRYHY